MKKKKKKIDILHVDAIMYLPEISFETIVLHLVFQSFSNKDIFFFVIFKGIYKEKQSSLANQSK